MNFLERLIAWCRPIGIVLFMAPAIACAQLSRGDVLYKPDDNPPKLEYREAKSLLAACFAKVPRSTITSTRILDDGFEWIRQDGTKNRFFHRNMTDPYVWEDSIWVRNLNSDIRYYMMAVGNPGPGGITLSYRADQLEFARRCADALYVLRRGLPPEPVEETNAFKDIVDKFRGNAAPPEFPEDARRLRVQAESALRDKRLDDASDRYEEALKIAAWWPEGRFNRALILGDLERYAEAMREMKRYLALVPEALNARAAQDKIYEWEDKVKR